MNRKNQRLVGITGQKDLIEEISSVGLRKTPRMISTIRRSTIVRTSIIREESTVA
jgi:hypothetical protein